MTRHKNEDTLGTAAGWWIAPGPVLCPWCEQPHHVEAMMYCSDCDVLICSVCVVVSLGSEPRCPSCFATPGEL